MTCGKKEKQNVMKGKERTEGERKRSRSPKKMKKQNSGLMDSFETPAPLFRKLRVRPCAPHFFSKYPKVDNEGGLEV